VSRLEPAMRLDLARAFFWMTCRATFCVPEGALWHPRILCACLGLRDSNCSAGAVVAPLTEMLHSVEGLIMTGAPDWEKANVTA